jgi:predicted restriction endonuclease
MKLVSPGDIVFSFKNTVIPAVGIIGSNGYEALKPDEFDSTAQNWDKVGWKVDVNYHDLSSNIRPKNIINELKAYLPEKYSPLTIDGNGLQSVYLAEVPQKMADVLISHMSDEERTFLASADKVLLDNDDVKDMAEEEVTKKIIASKMIDNTEKDALIKARRGQGIFKMNLMQYENRCRITKVNNPKHLIASHIKPWRYCETNEERLDGENGLLLTPSVDHLFDKGYLTFDDKSNLLISRTADGASLKQMGINVEEIINVGDFTAKQKIYLAYHRDNIFKR